MYKDWTFDDFFVIDNADDDGTADNTVVSDASLSMQALEGRVPNYLLLVSLLEHLCSLYEADPERSRKIFNGGRCYLLHSSIHND